MTAATAPKQYFDRVILVDDNEADNIYHSIILRKAGHLGAIEMHESGEAALDALMQETLQVPTLLFLDINMPGMSGFEFAEKAEPYLEQAKNLSVVMLTSSSAKEDIEVAARLSLIKGFIVKPLSKDLATDLLNGKIEPLVPGREF